MARPGTAPTWANTGSKTDPGGGKRALGWIAGEKPPAQFFNWWQGLVGDWINALALELDALVDIFTSGNTFSGVNTFTAHVDLDGGVDVNGGFDVETGGVSVLGGGNVTVSTGDVTATAGDVKAGGSFISAGGAETFTYAPGVARALAFPLSPAPDGLGFEGSSGEVVITDGSVGSFRDWPVRIRPGMSSIAIDVRARVIAGATVFKLLKCTTDWNTSSAMVLTQVDSQVAGGTGIQDFHLATLTVDPAVEYRLQWRPTDVGDTVIAVRVTFTEDAVGVAM